MTERRPATTIGELDIHLSNVMEHVQRVEGKIDLLATKNWVADELARRDARMDQLALSVTAETTGSKLKRASEVAQQLGTLLAWVVGILGVIGAIVHFWDKLPK
jgi:hypothetical protein